MFIDDMAQEGEAWLVKYKFVWVQGESCCLDLLKG